MFLTHKYMRSHIVDEVMNYIKPYSSVVRFQMFYIIIFQ